MCVCMYECMYYCTCYVDKGIYYYHFFFFLISLSQIHNNYVNL